MSHLYPIKSIEPFGGEGGQSWDDGKYNDVKKIKTVLESVINYTAIEYDKDGECIWSSAHGRSGNGDVYMVDLD